VIARPLGATTIAQRAIAQEHLAMNEQAKSDPKVQKPSAHFDEPHEVVVDSSLSKAQKVGVLDSLEQDARQLAEASSEGMGGGERNKLHDVLIAKDTLVLPPVAVAYETVLQDLRSRQKRGPASDTQIMLKQAIAALDGLVASFAQPSAPATDATPKSTSAAR
jgi:hypothetical protein